MRIAHLARQPGGRTLKRVDRSYLEILQELRVALTGVQFLVAFLMTVAFSQRFTEATAGQRGLHVASLLAGACASALLIAPAAYHRLVHGRRMKRQLVTMANRCAQLGLALLLISLSCAMLLILSFVLRIGPALLVTMGTLTWFAMWWYAGPLLSMFRCRRHRLLDPARGHQEETESIST